MVIIPVSKGTARDILTDQHDGKSRNTDSIQNYYRVKENNQSHTIKARSTSSSVMLDSSLHEGYDSAQDQWFIMNKTKFIYDSHGNNTLKTVYALSRNSNQWTEDDKFEYGYDGNGNLIREIYYVMSGNQWGSEYKNEYTYDAREKNTSMTVSYYFSDQWNYGNKDTYTFDNNGNNIIDSLYSWNSTSSRWDASAIHEYTYDSKGNKTMESDFTWNANLGEWLTGSKSEREYTYDAGGKIILEILSSWDNNNNQWIHSSKFENTYDSNGNEITQIFYTWSQLSSQWTNLTKYEYTYDTEGNNLSGTLYTWSGANNQWAPANKDIYHYISGITFVSTMTDKDILVYPNPASDFIVFVVADDSKPVTAEISDMQGKIILGQNLSVNNKVSVRDLNKGVYFYKIERGNKVYSGKIIKN